MSPLRFAAHLVAIGTLATGMVAAASRFPESEERAYDVRYIPKAGALRWMSFGHPTLVANLFWLRAIQYMGDPNAGRRGWEKLYPLLDLVTDLDPGHGYAYQTGGTVLGSVGRVAESDAILEKGMRNHPAHWINFFLRAFNAFYYEGDYGHSGEVLEQATQIPGAPEHLRDNALAMLVKGRRAEAAIDFLTAMRDQAPNPESREATQRQLDQAVLERDAKLLEDAIEKYRADRGAPPEQLEELVIAGLVSALPADPFGGRYLIGDDGRVHSSVHPFRFALPISAEQLRREGDQLQRQLEERNRRRNGLP